MKQTKTTLFGFTLLEILVAAGIIMLLTSVGIGAYANVNRRSRDARRSSDIEQIRQALEMYRSDFGYYPAVNINGFGNASALSASLVPTYMPAVPNDPRSATQPYMFQALNSSGGRYYGYCISGRLESQTTTNSTCTIQIPNTYNYGQKSP